MAIEYNFTLDMDRSKRDNNIAYARTGDVDSITINADLVFNGAAYTPTGTNAFFECVTPNGHSIRAAAEKSGSSVSVEVPSAAFQAAGVINVAYFRFESGGSDNPTYVESTEPFAIVVREGIGDDIDAGDYIEEWRGLADQLEAVVAEVEQKAEQAETAINEQKTEVDQLKAQAQTSIAQDTEDVSDAKDTAISNINGSQGAVDAAIEQLERKTQEAVDAAQEALDGTLATNLQNAIDRTLKLDVADMTDIQDSTSLSSLTAVGSYCCKTATSAATIGDSPINDSPFNMYVFSSADSGQVMQLVIPIDNQDKSTAEWYVRFGTSSAMDQWSVIGGGGGVMPDVVPVSQGGTGVTTAAAERNRLGLGNTTGALPVANGGTGATDAKAAQYSLLNGMAESTDALADSSMLVGYNASPSASNGAVHKRSMSTIWDYIAGKVADKVWDKLKTKAISSDTATGTDLTLVGGLESMLQTRTSTLTLGAEEMSLDNSNAAPLTVNGEEVITEGNISSHLPATFDAKSVWFSTPLTQGQQKNIITEGGFTLDELRKYFVPGNLVLANMVCGGDHGVQYETVVPMVITLGDGMVMQPTGITYNSIADAHFDCIFAVANNEQAGDGGGTGLADGVTLLYSVTEVPGYANRTSTSSLKGFTVFDVVSHAI